MALAEHSNYETMETVHGAYTPDVHITEEFPKRILIKDTDEGAEIQRRIEELKKNYYKPIEPEKFGKIWNKKH